jgi:DNA-binding transcriptional LysR family regulator
VDGDLAAGRLVAPLGRRLPSGAAFYLVMPERSRKLKDVRAFRDWLFHELEMTDK